MVPVTSDKGLCGGINTTVVKYARGTLHTVKEGTHCRARLHAAR